VTTYVRILENIQGNCVDAVDIEVFRRFVKKHPALLFPAFEMQRRMQEYTLGKGFWTRLGERRLRLSSGQFVPVKKFMEMHLAIIAYENRDLTPSYTISPGAPGAVRVAPSSSRYIGTSSASTNTTSSNNNTCVLSLLFVMVSS
jgi:hypothetical protein